MRDIEKGFYLSIIYILVAIITMLSLRVLLR